jgi:hypothetical protein
MRVVEVRRGKLIALPIVLGRSSKNDWGIVPAAHGPGDEFEQVQCHPDDAQPISATTRQFVVAYSTTASCMGNGRSKRL